MNNVPTRPPYSGRHSRPGFAGMLVAVAALLITAPGFAGTELIRNGDFTSFKSTTLRLYDLSDWRLDSKRITMIDVDPDYCAAGFCPEIPLTHFVCLNQGEHYSPGLLQAQNVNLETDTRYRLRFTALSNGSRPGRLNISVGGGGYSNHVNEFIEAPPSNLDISESASSSQLANALLSPYETEFVTPAETATYGFFIRFTALEENVCITNVSLKSVGSVGGSRVAVNNHGYIAGDTGENSKVAVAVNIPDISGYQWRLVYAGKPVFQDGMAVAGDIGPRRDDVDSGDSLGEIDFSHYAGKNSEPLYKIEIVDTAQSGRVVARSPSFAIQHGIYDPLKDDALYSFYLQRSGTPVEPGEYIDLSRSPTVSGPYRREAAHSPDVARCFSGTDLHGNQWNDCRFNTVVGYSDKLDVTGGWYDAADHGKYVVNAGVTLWTLQNQVERLQKKGKLDDAFPDGMMNYPASAGEEAGTNGVSDLLDEIRHEMEFLLSMQAPFGTLADVPVGYQDRVAPRSYGFRPRDYGVYQVKVEDDFKIERFITPYSYYAPRYAWFHQYLGDDTLPGDVQHSGGLLPRLEMKLELQRRDVGGLVFHAVHDRYWTGLPADPANYQVSHPDGSPVRAEDRRVLMYPTSAATLNLAAVGAQCYRIWSQIPGEEAFAQRCLDAAEIAWAAAKTLYDTDPGAEGRNEATGDRATESIFRYEYSNRPWDAADRSGKNRAALVNGFAVSPMFSGGGAYGDIRLSDEFYWAGIELYLATGDNAYWAAAKQIVGTDKNGNYSSCADNGMPVECYNWITAFDWQNVAVLGTLSAITADPDTYVVNDRDSAFTNLKDYADTLAGYVERQGYRFAKPVYENTNSRNTAYVWGSNSSVLNAAIILAITADQEELPATDAERYRNAVIQSMDYLLGRNTHAASFISQYGERAFANAHHRVYASHADLESPRLPPGFLAGGPNSRDIEAIMANMGRGTDGSYWQDGRLVDESGYFFTHEIAPACDYGKIAPQKCYRDHWLSFATSEIAINWQAPLLWISQYLTEVQRAVADTNIAGFATADASSSYCPGGTGLPEPHCYGPDRVNDGDTSTDLGGNYSWANASAGLPQSVWLTWPQQVTVDAVDVYTTADYPINRYELQYLNEEGEWVTVLGGVHQFQAGSRTVTNSGGYVLGNTGERITHSFDPVRTRSIRVLGLRGPAHQPYYVRVNEVVVREHR